VSKGSDEPFLPEDPGDGNGGADVRSLALRVSLAAADAPRRALAPLLPHGYPASVKDGYGHYAAFQFVGSTASSAGGVFSMQALLHAVGLGAGAIPMAAALNWVIKDGLGQLGGVLFVSNVNTRFDADPRRWRFVSSVALDASCLLELLAPAAPALFIPLAATANVGKNVSWLSASASRAAIHQSFATSANLGDVTAKAGSQSIAASLAGTTLGVALSSSLGPEWGAATLGAFGCLSAAHLSATYLSLANVRLEGLNGQRLGLVVDHFLNAWGRRASRSRGQQQSRASRAAVKDCHKEEEEEEEEEGKEKKGKMWKRPPVALVPALIPTPRAVAAAEGFVPRWPLEPFGGPGLGDWLVLGAPLPCFAPTPASLDHLRAASNAAAPASFDAAVGGTRGGESCGESSGGSGAGGASSCGYLLSLRVRGGSGGGNGGGNTSAALFLALETGAGPDALVRGVLHAAALRRHLQAHGARGAAEAAAVKAAEAGAAATMGGAVPSGRVEILGEAAARRAGLLRPPSAAAAPLEGGGGPGSGGWAHRLDLVAATAPAAREAAGALLGALAASEWRSDALHLDQPRALAGVSVGTGAVRPKSDDTST